MNLLFTRSQFRSSIVSIIPFRIGGNVTFRLKAELELSDDELALARRYYFTQATLIASDTYEDLGRAYRPALFLGIVAAIASAFMLPSMGRGPDAFIMKVITVPAIGLVTLLVLTFFYFTTLRKHVTVSQLMNGGRTFYCHSVVELDEQEAELRDICKRFHGTLEKAKNWWGREINPIPDGEPFYLPDASGAGSVPGSDSAIEKHMHTAGTVTKKLLTPFTLPPDAQNKNQAEHTTPPPTQSETPPSIFQKPAAAPPPVVQPTQPSRTTPAPTTPPQSPMPPTSSPTPGPSTPQTHTPAPPAQQTKSPPTTNPSPTTPQLHPLAPKPPKDDPDGL